MSQDKVKTCKIKTENLIEFEQSLKESDSSTLVVFDIDEVIFTSKDQILHPSYRKYFDSFIEGLSTKFDPIELKKLMTIILKARQKVIIDPTIFKVFDHLYSKKIMTIALTHWPTGAMTDDDRYEHFRISQLQEFGIDFHKIAPHKGEIILTNLPSAHGSPVMHKGVVLTGLVEKGIVLEHILNKIDFKPKKVIFIDDLIENILSVEAYCIRLGIEFIGFEYTAVASSPTEEFVEKRAKLQFESLIKEKVWLNDEEADLKLNKAFETE